MDTSSYARTATPEKRATAESARIAGKPIIFSSAMIQALLSNSKSQTRRILKPQPQDGAGAPIVFTGDRGEPLFVQFRLAGGDITKSQRLLCAPGDRLFVREAWRTEARYDEARPSDLLPPNLARDMRQRAPLVSYEADYTQEPNDGCRGRLRPSIHMPRWASRLTLIVEGVKVERLQEISEADAQAEGIGEPYLGDGDPPFEERAVMVSRKMQFRNLWRTLHGPDAWDANPWVAVISFRAVVDNIDTLEAA